MMIDNDKKFSWFNAAMPRFLATVAAGAVSYGAYTLMDKMTRVDVLAGTLDTYNGTVYQVSRNEVERSRSEIARQANEFVREKSHRERGKEVEDWLQKLNARFEQDWTRYKTAIRDCERRQRLLSTLLVEEGQRMASLEDDWTKHKEQEAKEVQMEYEDLKQKLQKRHHKKEDVDELVWKWALEDFPTANADLLDKNSSTTNDADVLSDNKNAPFFGRDVDMNPFISTSRGDIHSLRPYQMRFPHNQYANRMPVPSNPSPSPLTSPLSVVHADRLKRRDSFPPPPNNAVLASQVPSFHPRPPPALSQELPPDFSSFRNLPHVSPALIAPQNLPTVPSKTSFPAFPGAQPGALPHDTVFSYPWNPNFIDYESEAPSSANFAKDTDEDDIIENPSA